jgi:hypothetical protein
VLDGNRGQERIRDPIADCPGGTAQIQEDPEVPVLRIEGCDGR